MTLAIETDLTLDDFDYVLPPEFIAQFPCDKRTHSRLMYIDKRSQQITHQHFYDVKTLLKPGDLLILNNTRVIPARLYGRKDSGGQVELLVERIINDKEVIAFIKASKAPKVGQIIILSERTTLEVIARKEDQFQLQCNSENSPLALLQQHGHIPLPPYMQRHDQILDKERYQTVYAKHDGAIAAPTAGLHFDEALLNDLQHQGIQLAYVTLHVGAGTFQPVRSQRIQDHQMHAEYLEVSQTVCDAVHETKQRGGRVIAVGTTVVRSLETAMQSGTLKPFAGDSQLFIYPGFQFQCIDGMITNFHLPKSSLLMLVSAFSGIELIRQAYQVAIQQHYRFFSYGDAMLLL